MTGCARSTDFSTRFRQSRDTCAEERRRSRIGREEQFDGQLIHGDVERCSEYCHGTDEREVLVCMAYAKRYYDVTGSGQLHFRFSVVAWKRAHLGIQSREFGVGCACNLPPQPTEQVRAPLAKVRDVLRGALW